MKISIAQLNPTIGDFPGNLNKILHAIEKGKNQGAQLLLFSECILTGYPAEDRLLYSDFIKQTEKALQEILPYTKGISAIIGLPTRCNALKREKKTLQQCSYYLRW